MMMTERKCFVFLFCAEFLIVLASLLMKWRVRLVWERAVGLATNVAKQTRAGSNVHSKIINSLKRSKTKIDNEKYRNF